MILCNSNAINILIPYNYNGSQTQTDTHAVSLSGGIPILSLIITSLIKQTSLERYNQAKMRKKDGEGGSRDYGEDQLSGIKGSKQLSAAVNERSRKTGDCLMQSDWLRGRVSVSHCSFGSLCTCGCQTEFQVLPLTHRSDIWIAAAATVLTRL